MRNYRCDLSRWATAAALVFLIVAPRVVQADEQVITPDPLDQEVPPSSGFSIDINYTTIPEDPTLTGIGFRIHFDSSKLMFVDVTDSLVFGRLFNPSLLLPEPDTADFDGDAATDVFLGMAWTDFRFAR